MKLAVIALLIVPCVVVLAACGGSNIKLDEVVGEYKLLFNSSHSGWEELERIAGESMPEEEYILTFEIKDDGYFVLTNFLFIDGKWEVCTNEGVVSKIKGRTITFKLETISYGEAIRHMAYGTLTGKINSDGNFVYGNKIYEKN